jgi:hypothetical protein
VHDAAILCFFFHSLVFGILWIREVVSHLAAWRSSIIIGLPNFFETRGVHVRNRTSLRMSALEHEIVP